MLIWICVPFVCHRYSIMLFESIWIGLPLMHLSIANLLCSFNSVCVRARHTSHSLDIAVHLSFWIIIIIINYHRRLLAGIALHCECHTHTFIQLFIQNWCAIICSPLSNIVHRRVNVASVLANALGTRERRWRNFSGWQSMPRMTNNKIKRAICHVIRRHT